MTSLRGETLSTEDCSAEYDDSKLDKLKGAKTPIIPFKNKLKILFLDK